MRGKLTNVDDLAWLLAWLRSSVGERLDIVCDDSLRGVEFEADSDGLRISRYLWDAMNEVAQLDVAAVLQDGQWLGMN